MRQLSRIVASIALLVAFVFAFIVAGAWFASAFLVILVLTILFWIVRAASNLTDRIFSSLQDELAQEDLAQEQHQKDSSGVVINGVFSKTKD